MADKNFVTDAGSHGKLSVQDGTIWWHGLCIRRSFWTVHVKCEIFILGMLRPRRR